MRRSEFEELNALAKKWIKESASDIEELKRTKLRPLRCAELDGALDAKQQCTEELIDFLKRVLVTNEVNSIRRPENEHD